MIPLIMRLRLDFKTDTKIKTSQNRILNMKKDGIRTPRVQFEMRKIRIILENVKMMSIFSVSSYIFIDTNIFKST